MKIIKYVIVVMFTLCFSFIICNNSLTQPTKYKIDQTNSVSKNIEIARLKGNVEVLERSISNLENKTIEISLRDKLNIIIPIITAILCLFLSLHYDKIKATKRSKEKYDIIVSQCYIEIELIVLHTEEIAKDAASGKASKIRLFTIITENLLKQTDVAGNLPIPTYKKLYELMVGVQILNETLSFYARNGYSPSNEEFMTLSVRADKLHNLSRDILNYIKKKSLFHINC